MKKYGFMVILWLIFLTATSTFLFSDTNIVKNGDFEDIKENGYPLYWQTKSWDNANPSRFLAVPGRDGKGHAFKVINPTPNDSHIYQTVFVEPDTLYKISAWIKADKMDATDKGANISELHILDTSRPIKNSNGEWIQTELYGRTAPDQTQLTLTLRLGGYGHLSQGEAIFEDVIMIPVSSAPENTRVIRFSGASNQTDTTMASTEQQKTLNDVKRWKLLIFPLLILLFFLIYLFSILLPKFKEKINLPDLSAEDQSLKARILRFLLQPSLLRSLLILFLTWGVLLVILNAKVLIREENYISSSFDHVWSDWPFHFGIASVFAYRSPSTWFSNHPMYYGGNLRYPFLTDFLSGMLMKLGIPIHLAFIIPTYIFLFALLAGIFLLTNQVLKSRAAAFLSVSLFLLSSGLGVYRFWVNFLTSSSKGGLFVPGSYFTRMDQYSWYSGNIIHGILLPQRAFLLGMTLAIWALFLLINTMEKQSFNTPSKIKLLTGGILTGLLPIAHMHSFIAVFILAGAYCLLSIKQIKKLLYYILPAGLLSTFLCILFIFGKSSMQNFFNWMPGFTAQGGFGGWLLMWLKLFGIAIPLACWGFILYRKKLPLPSIGFFCGFFLLFVAANLLRFQAVAWDNSKIFFWSYLGFSMLASVSILFLWKKKKGWRFAAIVCVYLMISTGILDIEQMLSVKKYTYKLENADNMELAKEIRENTDEMALFITDTSHNHFIMAFAARPILLGFTGWMGNFGFEYQQRERDLKAMYQSNAHARELLKQYGVSYIVVGSAERQKYKPDEEYMRNTYTLAFSSNQYNIYDVRQYTLPEGKNH